MGGAASLRMTRGLQGRERKNKMPYQLVLLCYILYQRNYALHSIQPTCHPERSGTPGVGANATTKQRRAVEPRPPGGAPAGGISVVPAWPSNATTHPGFRTERSEGGDFEAPPQIRLSTFFRKKLQEFQSFTAKGTRNAVRINHVPPHGCPLR